MAWLKVLNLSHSKYLKETPDFSGLPSLEQLILKDCPRLREVHQSIGCLCNLILLNLKDCTSLSNLPEEIYKLKCLKTLILSGCSKMDLMENDRVRMKSLITIIAENTVMKQLPFTIVSPKNIGYISYVDLRNRHIIFFLLSFGLGCRQQRIPYLIFIPSCIRKIIVGMILHHCLAASQIFEVFWCNVTPSFNYLSK